MALGIYINREMYGIKGRFKISRKMFPTYMLAMTPQKISGWSWNSNGPGWMPITKKAPSRTAVVPEPGIPRLSKGTKAPPDAALLDVSGAATPTKEPFPNAAGFLDKRFSVI